MFGSFKNEHSEKKTSFWKGFQKLSFFFHTWTRKSVCLATWNVCTFITFSDIIFYCLWALSLLKFLHFLWHGLNSAWDIFGSWHKRTISQNHTWKYQFKKTTRVHAVAFIEISFFSEVHSLKVFKAWDSLLTVHCSLTCTLPELLLGFFFF